MVHLLIHTHRLHHRHLTAHHLRPRHLTARHPRLLHRTAHHLPHLTERLRKVMGHHPGAIMDHLATIMVQDPTISAVVITAVDPLVVVTDLLVMITDPSEMAIIMDRAVISDPMVPRHPVDLTDLQRTINRKVCGRKN